MELENVCSFDRSDSAGFPCSEVGIYRVANVALGPLALGVLPKVLLDIVLDKLSESWLPAWLLEWILPILITVPFPFREGTVPLFRCITRRFDGDIR